MKRFLLSLLTLCVLVSVDLNAQIYDNAVGLRLGWGFGGSIKHFFSEKSAIEGVLRFGGYYSSYTQITGLYQIYSPLDDVAPGLQWYYGGGGFIGFFGGGGSGNDARIGIAGNIGLDYAFENIPLNISLDWVPAFAIVGFGRSFLAGEGGLAVRYIF